MPRNTDFYETCQFENKTSSIINYISSIKTKRRGGIINSSHNLWRKSNHFQPEELQIKLNYEHKRNHRIEENTKSRQICHVIQISTSSSSTKIVVIKPVNLRRKSFHNKDFLRGNNTKSWLESNRMHII